MSNKNNFVSRHFWARNLGCPYIRTTCNKTHILGCLKIAKFKNAISSKTFLCRKRQRLRARMEGKKTIQNYFDAVF